MASELTELLVRHVTASRLTNKEIAARLGVDHTAVSKWLNDANGISRLNLSALLDLLLPVPEPGFGEPHADRARAEALWQDAQRARLGRTRRSGSSRSAAALPADENPPSVTWDVANPEPITKLVELKLFEPEQTNDGAYLLFGRLEFGLRDDETTDTPVRLGVRDAFLAVSTAGQLLRDETLIGKRADHDHLKAEPGGLGVVGPRDAGPCLQGEVFGGAHVAVLRPTEREGDHVTVTVSVGRRDFVAMPLDADGACLTQPMDSEAKNAVLNLLIYGDARIARDELGRPLLQKATLRRRPST